MQADAGFTWSFKEEFREEPDAINEKRSFLRGPCRQDVPVVFVTVLVEAADFSPALRCQADGDRSAVGRVGLTLDQLEIDELVHRPAESAGVEAEALGERDEGRGAAFAELDEGMALSQCHSAAVRFGFELTIDLALDLSQVPAKFVNVRFLHPASYAVFYNYCNIQLLSCQLPHLFAEL